jgi:UDP:flavonoid glycosyltransferase YjiC (YdhE family)
MRLLFTSMPIHSHLTPMLPLAVAAGRAGHTVAFATGPDAIGYVEKQGLPGVPAGLSRADAGHRYRQLFPPESIAGLSSRQRLDHRLVHAIIGISAPAMVADLMPYARTFAPDVIVSNLVEYGGRVTSVALGVPHVTHGFGPPKPAGPAPEVRAAAVALYRRWAGDVDWAAHSARPYLDIWPLGLHPRGTHVQLPNRWPLRPDGVLPSPGPVRRPEVLDGLPHPRTVYVTLGTTHNRRAGALETMIEALRDAPANLVVTIGPDGDLDRFAGLPDHVRVARFVAQDTLLPHCDVVVCHAGAGTVLGALAHGVPLVLAPVASDQFEIAEQVAAAGAGLVCARPVTAAAVRRAYDTIGAEPGYRAAAARIRDEILAMPTPAAVVERLAGPA